MCWLAQADVIQGGITFRLINLDMLFTTCTPIIIPGFLAQAAQRTIYIAAPSNI